jgi:hypothetical protein
MHRQHCRQNLNNNTLYIHPGDEPGFFFAPTRAIASMASRKTIKPPQAMRTGPIKAGSPLYRLLEVIAARVATRMENEAQRK